MSRGHRHPKPYRPLLLRRDGCAPDPAAVPWPAVSAGLESTSRHGALFWVTHVYLQVLGGSGFGVSRVWGFQAQGF